MEEPLEEGAGRPVELTWSEEGVPYAPAYGDVYYSRSGAAQGDLVFVEGSELPRRFAAGEAVQVVETGLGLGINLLAAVRALGRAGGGALAHASIELHPLPAALMAEVHRRLGPPDAAVEAFLRAYPELLRAGQACLEYRGCEVPLQLEIGDGAAALGRLDLRADAVFLDGFAPARNPGMWSEGVYRELARLARPGATIATYTAAGSVRAGLQRAGFDVERRAGFGLKKHRLVGTRRAGA